MMGAAETGGGAEGEEEIARLRQEQVHKAQPIRHYKPVAVKRVKFLSPSPTHPTSPTASDCRWLSPLSRNLPFTIFRQQP
ncbi:targeting protein for Xklp2-like [Micropterus salmoides]|uniref:targeting protein for Xklp2-like n=1 Tax=Micropterus salmoides TaxID=27706 RepID=UPI0018EDE38D|nr:targeting protein for Xklp2-like [Micropterus salmoides]